MRKQVVTRTLVLAAIIGVTGLFIVSQGHRAATGHADVRVSQQDWALAAKAFGVRFSPKTTPAGRSPLLPGGRAGISMDEALTVARSQTPAGVDEEHRVLPGVQVTAQFGLFSDDRYGERGTSGRVQPYLQDVPVWLVNFSGPGVEDRPLGGGVAASTPTIGGSGALGTSGAHHEENLVIDAATGQFLLGYTYR